MYRLKNIGLFCSRRIRRQDEIAFVIARRYGLEKLYLEAREQGLKPIEALEEWDLIRPEDISLFEKEGGQG